MIEQDYRGATTVPSRMVSLGLSGLLAHVLSVARQTRIAACGLALFLSDLLALAGAVAGALGLGVAVRCMAGLPPKPAHVFTENAASIENTLLALLGLTLCLAARGHYRERLPFWGEARDIVAWSSLTLLVACFLEFSLRTNGPRLQVIGVWLLYPFVTIPLRQLVKRGLTAVRLWQIPVVLVGDARSAATALALFGSEANPGYRVMQVLQADALGHLGSIVGWRSLLARAGAEQIVFAHSLAAAPQPDLIGSVVRERIPFAVISDASGLPVFGCERMPFFNHDAVLLSYKNNLAQPVSRAVKLATDLAIAILLLLLLSPLLLLLAALVRLDGGPALYAHPRIGFGGRRFKCLKFRTMVTNADAVLQILLASQPDAAREWAETRKLRHDPRITWIGRWLRRLSLDELPQLLNVLRLEMSLVGPRPIVEQEVPRYAEDIAFYYEARPGLTGLWQVNGRSETSYAKRVQLDCWYIKNWTVWHDLIILVKTLPAVLRRRGAR